MSQRDFTEVEPAGTSSLPAASRALFVDKVRASNAACQAGDFSTAVALYTDALALDPGNHILYSNRSAARLKQGQFAAALQDAIRARELCPTWPKAYYRQGVALQCLGRHGEALAAFSSGLGVEPTSQQLVSALIEASLKSPLRPSLEPTFRQLETMKLHQSPFVLISVVGQELLAAGQYHAAVTVLEAALRIGSCSLKLRGSVFSALSSAHWALNQLDAAINYMQQDLAVAKSLGDTAGECRAHGNLGAAYFSQGSFKEALTAHRYQLVLAMKCKDTQAAGAALTSLGHVYTATGDYPNALASHKQCVQLVKQTGDKLQEAREIGNVGAVYLAMGEFDSAVDCHTQHLRIARRLGNQVEEARAYSNLGSSHHYRRNFTQAIAYHENVLRIAQTLGDRSIEARAYAGLGHAARCAGDYAQAKKWHERQLDVALAARDKVGEGRACSNLGIVYQLLGEHDAALKLHQAHLSIARQLQDKAGMGRAYGNIGNAYSAAGYYEQAIKYHKQELGISKEVHDRSSEASTHGNLAVAYQALGAHDMALFHYRAHLGIARELKDTAGEACALLNLGNCLSSRGEFAQAIPYYEQYLMLSQELGDVAAEAKACHFLGYAHYCIGNYKEAVRYYDQDLSLAKDLQDKMNMGRAYCNLGLAHLALGNLETALECQKYFLAIAHMTQHLPGKFRALGNIGDVLIKMGDVEEAVKMYQRQLGFARQAKDVSLEAGACGALGLARRLQRRYDAALQHHAQELSLRRRAGDAAGEARAHGHLGAVQMALGQYGLAIRSYQEQLEKAQELQDCAVEAQAYGNLGIARLNLAHYEEAIGCFEQQLAILERQTSSSSQMDTARALGSLGDCYDALGDPDEALKYYEQHLTVALNINSSREQERAYAGLGRAHKSVGNLQEALVCLEKRLVVSHELGGQESKAYAYGELGLVHAALGNLDQAVSCLDHQKNIARELNDKILEAEAVSALGGAHRQLGQHAAALRCHQAELELAHQLGHHHLQARACSGLGESHAALGSHAEAARWLEASLRHATAAGDARGRAQALAALGRAHLALGAAGTAVTYLRQALAATDTLHDSEEEARVRHRLGFALWARGELDEAREHVQGALALLEAPGPGPERRGAATVAGAGARALYASAHDALQALLVDLGRDSEALLVAERGRLRGILKDNLDVASSGLRRKGAEELCKSAPSTLDQLLESVNKQRSPVLYYSLASGRLLAWLLMPHKGIVKFHQQSLVEEENGANNLPGMGPEDLQSITVTGRLNKLEAEIAAWQEAVNTSSTSAGSDDKRQETVWESSDETPDKAPFLRMTNRTHIFNTSNYSLSSLFSVGSVGGSVASLQGSTRSSGSIQQRLRKQSLCQGPPCLASLYQLLLAPFEELLPASCNNNASHNRKACGGRRDLVIVIQGALWLVPFAALRPSEAAEHLAERYCILALPSLGALARPKTPRQKAPREVEGDNSMRCLVVGAPKATTRTFAATSAQLKEASLVADMLRASPLTDYQASKEAVLAQMPHAECIHFATHIAWKHAALVLSAGEVVDTPTTSKRLLDMSIAEDSLPPVSEEDSQDMQNNSISIELPHASEFLLTAADIMKLKISARLVVISCPSGAGGQAERALGCARLCSALLAAGAHCVLLISAHPAAHAPAHILLRAFYSALLQGERVGKALGDAMQTVQHTRHFGHPRHWAGALLLGASCRLSSKVALMGQALCDLLAKPHHCRDALRVSLHLVEKSLQRIVRGQKNAMYTTQRSIENKVGAGSGWRELLMSVGFRFEPAANGIPSSVFFPQSDPEERLAQCSASLQALLSLTPATLQALSKMLSNPEVADDVISVIRNVIDQFSSKGSDETIEVAVSVRLWRAGGCHELLSSLGLELLEVGGDDVTLRAGKAASRRLTQATHTALLALFDTQEAPRSLSLESSSSVESLASAEDMENAAQSDSEIHASAVGPLNDSASQVPPPPIPLGGGAFTMYVRAEANRGEPDGRVAPVPPNPQPTFRIEPPKQPFSNYIPEASYAQTPAYRSDQDIYNSQKAPQNPKYRGESDAAFTPSPPANHSPAASRDVSLGLAHQTKIRTLYAKRPSRRPASTSSSDWEGSGHDTVLRRAPPPPAPDENQITQADVEAAYRLVCPDRRRFDTDFYDRNNVQDAKKADEPQPSTSKRKTRDLSSQIRHMSGELTPTITEVYHERNLGLGLAPPLSKLLLNQNTTEMRAATSKENLLLQNLEKFNLIEDSKQTVDSSESDQYCESCRDKNCNCRPKCPKPWLSGAPPLNSNFQSSDLTTAEIIERTRFKKETEINDMPFDLKESDERPPTVQKRPISPFEMSRRDEADGRSIADSHSSYHGVVLNPGDTTITSRNPANTGIIGNSNANSAQDTRNPSNLIMNPETGSAMFSTNNFSNPCVDQNIHVTSAAVSNHNSAKHAPVAATGQNRKGFLTNLIPEEVERTEVQGKTHPRMKRMGVAKPVYNTLDYNSKQ